VKIFYLSADRPTLHSKVFYSLWWGHSISTKQRPLAIVHAAYDRLMSAEHWWNCTDEGKPEHSEATWLTVSARQWVTQSHLDYTGTRYRPGTENSSTIHPIYSEALHNKIKHFEVSLKLITVHKNY